MHCFKSLDPEAEHVYFLKDSRTSLTISSESRQGLKLLEKLSNNRICILEDSLDICPVFDMHYPVISAE